MMQKWARVKSFRYRYTCSLPALLRHKSCRHHIDSRHISTNGYPVRRSWTAYNNFMLRQKVVSEFPLFWTLLCSTSIGLVGFDAEFCRIANHDRYLRKKVSPTLVEKIPSEPGTQVPYLHLSRVTCRKNAFGPS